MFLNYLFPGEDEQLVTEKFNMGYSLLHPMVESNPDVIFFFTVHTTDID